jgi:hypothetical protein
VTATSSSSSAPHETQEQSLLGRWLSAFGESTEAEPEYGRRLCLTGECGGRPPALAEDKACQVSFDGVLHNRAELHQCYGGSAARESNDAGLILQAYRQRGEQALREVKGIFALLIFDRRKQMLLAVRDPIGIYPLFYAAAGRELMFSNSIESLRCHPRVSGEVNRAALADPRVRRDSILDAYYRSVLPMALQAQGAEVLHASAVFTPGGVVALCARSGTGKSTLAYGLSWEGYPLRADDAVAFESSAAQINVRPLPFSIRLRPDAAAFFDQVHVPSSLASIPDSATQVDERWTPLAALIVLERFPLADRLAHMAVQPLAPVRAVTELLTHAHCFSLKDPERKERMVHHYLELSAKVPVFKLCFRTGLENLEVILERIRKLVEDDLAASDVILVPQGYF